MFRIYGQYILFYGEYEMTNGKSIHLGTKILSNSHSKLNLIAEIG